MPLALARRAAEQARMAKAVAELEAHGEVVTSRSLAAAARISREHRMCLAPWARNGHDGIGSSVISSAI